MSSWNIHHDWPSIDWNFLADNYYPPEQVYDSLGWLQVRAAKRAASSKISRKNRDRRGGHQSAYIALPGGIVVCKPEEKRHGKRLLSRLSRRQQKAIQRDAVEEHILCRKLDKQEALEQELDEAAFLDSLNMDKLDWFDFDDADDDPLLGLGAYDEQSYEYWYDEDYL